MAAMVNMFNRLDLILMLQAAVPLGMDQRKKEVDHRNHLQIKNRQEGNMFCRSSGFLEI